MSLSRLWEGDVKFAWRQESKTQFKPLVLWPCHYALWSWALLDCWWELTLVQDGSPWVNAASEQLGLASDLSWLRSLMTLSQETCKCSQVWTKRIYVLLWCSSVISGILTVPPGFRFCLSQYFPIGLECVTHISANILLNLGYLRACKGLNIQAVPIPQSHGKTQQVIATLLCLPFSKTA